VRAGFPRRTPAAWAVHPGEVLREEFLVPMGITEYRLARLLAVPPQSVNDIALEKRGISADMAVRLGRFFGTSPEFWMNLQSAYELAKARSSLGRRIDRIQPHTSAA
jgi:addiction module HigA family antidote